MICVHHDGTVKEVRFDGDLKTIYDAGHYGTFDVVRLRHGLAMFVDDEGLCKAGWENRVNWKAVYLRLNQWMEAPRAIAWYALNRCPPLIVGDVCILAVNDEGGSVEPDAFQRKFILDLLGEAVK